MTNPLLQTWTTPFQIAPFAEISDDDFAPALGEALTAHLAEIDAIAENAEPPTFENTIEAMEGAGETLGNVLSVFYSIAGADSTPKRQELQRDFSPKLSAHSSAINSNTALFARVETLWNARDTLDLNDEQARVLMLTHRGFVRAGAALMGDDEAKMKEVKSRLAVLGTQFVQNLLKDEADWFMPLSNDALAELPDFVQDAAQAAGNDKNADGAVVTLSRSLIVPF